VRHFLERAGHDPAKLVTIHYGLDEPPATPSSPTPAEAGVVDGVPLAVAVGRLIEQKDHEPLLRAFALVHRNQPHARLAILGSGPLETRTRSLAAELGLAEVLTMPGRTDVRDWLERADVFVHSSRWEGFGIVLLEAMLAGLPVVSTRVSAVPEIVVDGETGALVGPGDVQGLAASLTSLLADPALAQRLGAAGRARALTEFSVGRMVERTLEVYRAD
jgi:glycosyltransferase involved in cell wall biosynthesis